MCQWITDNGITFPLGNTFQSLDDFLLFLSKHRKEFINQSVDLLPTISGKLQSNTYVASLTNTIQSPIMWAHYACNHEGFAIEYQFPPEFFSPSPMLVPNSDYNWYGWRSLLPVLYDERRADGTQLAEWYALCEWHNLIIGEERKEYDMNWALPDLLLKTKLCLIKALECS